MANCRKCNAEIPDGKELCPKCEQLNSESYLDSLLHTVISENQMTQEAEDAKKRLLKKMQGKIGVDPEDDLQEEFLGTEDAGGGISDHPQEETFDGTASEKEEEISPESEFAAGEILEGKSEAAEIREEEILKGDSSVEENTIPDIPKSQESADMPRKETETSLANYAQDNENDDKYLLTPEEEKAFELESLAQGDYDIFDDDISDNEFDGMLREIEDTGKAPAVQEPEGDTFLDLGEAESENATAVDARADEVIPEPEPESEREPEVAKDIKDITEEINTPELSDLLNTPERNDLSESMGERDGGMAAAELGTENEEFNSEPETQEDILDLINSIYNSEEGKPEAQEEAGIASEEPYGTEDDLEMSGKQDDFSDILTDVLPDEELAVLQDIGQTDGEEEDSGKKKKGKKEKKSKEKKPSIFKRLFGNIKTERSEEEIAQMKEKIIADAEAKEAAKEAKIKQAAAAKEEKKKKAAEEKAAAAKKKQEDAKKKAEEAKAKKEAKKEAKDKKKQEVQNLIDAIDEDEGRINRVGAGIVFVFFAIVALAILVGTNIYSYKQGVENARQSFEYDHYNEAYEEISGFDEMWEEDETFALQVMVVMYTYKQLNSFNHYYAAGLYPEALDSLLKGLKRYDKYSSIATVIQVDEDLDSVRGEILEKLAEVYSLTEQDAVALAAIKDQVAYTQHVYEIADRAY